MTLDRRSYTTTEELELTTQVGSYCPLCLTYLFHIKKDRSYKLYELAHIYPLNPKPEELVELKDVDLLNVDRNHIDNLLPLCTSCHTKFDKPRTLAEYIQLYNIKRKLLDKQLQHAIMREYPLEKDIQSLLSSLITFEFNNHNDSDLSYSALSVDIKCNKTMPSVLRKKIKHNVADYYQFILKEFTLIEQQFPSKSQSSTTGKAGGLKV